MDQRMCLGLGIECRDTERIRDEYRVVGTSYCYSYGRLWKMGSIVVIQDG